MPRRDPQLALELPVQPTWGGSRAGAGRKPAGAGAGLSHVRRGEVARSSPVHVTLRARPHVWNLRTERCFRIVTAALRGVRERDGFAVVHFSVQGNHLHLLVEADSAAALSNGIRALSIRLAKGLNTLMGTRGSVFADRYHARSLSTPTEARHALRYVVANFASHSARGGRPVTRAFVDRFSSLHAPAVPHDAPGPAVRPAKSWLLRQAARAVLAPDPSA